MDVEIGSEVAKFLFWEYINGIFVALCRQTQSCATILSMFVFISQSYRSPPGPYGPRTPRSRAEGRIFTFSSLEGCTGWEFNIVNTLFLRVRDLKVLCHMIEFKYMDKIN
jgi:hypothetical protein